MRVDSALNTNGGRTTSTFLDWAFIAPAFVTRIAGNDFSYVAFALLVVHAARGLPQAIQAIFLSWLFASLNTRLFLQTPDIEMLRILIIVVATTRVIMHALDPRKSAILSGSSTLPLLLFLAICGANSIWVSPIPEISILKTILFGLTSLSLLGAWAGLGSLRERIEAWVFHGLSVVAILSALIVPFGLGYEVNGRDFQGILNHPQAFGVMMALLSTWQLGFFLQRRLFSWFQLLRLAFFVALLISSHSRTGLLAFGLAILCAGLFSLFSRRSDLSSVLRSLGHPFVVACGGAIAFLLIVYSQTYIPVLETFTLKGDVDSTLEKSFEGSRGLLVDRSFDNFLQQPIFGNGFAMPSYLGDLDVIYDPFFGLPVGASVEKGVLPVAVLEELGVVGAFFLLFLLYSLFRQVMQRGSYQMLGLFVCAFAVNLGEAVLFSPSGMGLLVWVIIGMAAAPNSGFANKTNKNNLPSAVRRRSNVEHWY